MEKILTGLEILLAIVAAGMLSLIIFLGSVLYLNQFS